MADEEMSRAQVDSVAERDDELRAAQEDAPFLNKEPKKRVGKHIRRRWDRMESTMRRVQAELKVNYRRYLGDQFVQIHPRDPNRVWEPPTTGNKRTPPAINKIRRSVHRYAAQVTSDEPVIEALPATHAEQDRDAAEAATHALRGEWHRMSLQRELQRVAHLAGILRSGFWFFQWDDMAGGKTKAQKFIDDPETNKKELRFVNSSGEPVDDPKDAANIWQGNIEVEVMTPMNVRWSGSRYAHNAKELMVAKLVTLRELYEAFPKTKDLPLDKLLGGVPREAEKWLQDLRGEDFESYEIDMDDYGLESLTGHDTGSGKNHKLLDQPVFLMHYFLPPGRQYSNGFHGIVAGSHLVHRGGLRYGVMPIAHFKLIDEPSDILGLALVDILKDPQELLDFVRGKIVQHLHMMRRRWFLPQQSNVSTRDLMGGTRTVIEYNAKAGKPVAEEQPEIARSVYEFLEQSDELFDEQMGMSPISKGQHVPGVQSGRHAEALQAGDRTLLGLTRQQFKDALEHAGLVILRMVKKEWTTERRVRYMGDGRQFIDRAFSRTDFGETGAVRLKESTLLMLTRSQKLETIFSYAEVGALTPQDVRRLAPLADTTGIQLDEDAHVQRARRQNEQFLKGPNDAAKRAWKDFEAEMTALSKQLERVQERAATVEGEKLQPLLVTLQEEVAEVEEKFNAEMRKVMPTRRMSEDMPGVAAMHAEQHAKALASEKTERLPTWWVEWFEDNHFMVDMQAAQPPAPGGEEIDGAGMGPGQIKAQANPQELPPPGL